jgi:hypothetical protein
MMIMENQGLTQEAQEEQDKYKIINYDYNSSVSTTFFKFAAQI